MYEAEPVSFGNWLTEKVYIEKVFNISERVLSQSRSHSLGP